MTDRMTRRERLLAVLGGEPVDRVPISSGSFNEWADDWKSAEPSYRRLVTFCREHCDGLLAWGPRPLNQAIPGVALDEAEIDCDEAVRSDGARETMFWLRTPRGTLTKTTRRTPDTATVWVAEHLCKGPEDAERLLSVPEAEVRWDAGGFDDADRLIGDAGLVQCEMPDALCLAAALFDFGTYCIVAATEQELFERLLARFHRHVMQRLDAVLSAGPVQLVRIYGPEYAVPPFMPPHLFDRYVVPYVSEMIERIHAVGAFVRIHCHSNVRSVLPTFIEMGADATDPVEPPPAGDVTLAEAKRIADGRLTLCGNLELCDLEALDRDGVVELTRRAVAEGKPGGRFVLMPAAEPITIPLSRKLETNWMAYIETGIEAGRYD